MSRTDDLERCPTEGCSAWVEAGAGTCLRCVLRAERDDAGLEVDVHPRGQALEEPAAMTAHLPDLRRFGDGAAAVSWGAAESPTRRVAFRCGRLGARASFFRGRTLHTPPVWPPLPEVPSPFFGGAA